MNWYSDRVWNFNFLISGLFMFTLRMCFLSDTNQWKHKKRNMIKVCFPYFLFGTGWRVFLNVFLLLTVYRILRTKILRSSKFFGIKKFIFKRWNHITFSHITWSFIEDLMFHFRLCSNVGISISSSFRS